MRHTCLLAAVVLALTAACTSKAEVDSLAPGTEVTVKEDDGAIVTGKLVDVTPDQLTVEAAKGTRTIVKRDRIARLDVTLPALADDRTTPAPAAPEWREVTIPEGTSLSVRLETPVASDTSRIEQLVHGRLSEPIQVDGLTALPTGSELDGTVIDVVRAAKVKGRAHVALKFDSVSAHDERYEIQTATISRTARATKQKDAAKIGIGAGAGALIGAIIGGGKGAAIGATTGGGAGTAVVLSTRGEEVRIPSGTVLSVRLTEPLRVRVRV